MPQSNDDPDRPMQAVATAPRPEASLATRPDAAPEATLDPQRGIVMVLTGEGKGKSTAAFGAACRMLGWDRRVGVVQFTRGEWQTGERRFLEGHDLVDWIVSGEGFDWSDEAPEQSAQSAMEAFAQAAAMMVSGDYGLIVLDEVNWAMENGDLDPAAALGAIADRDAGCSVILTGRHAPASVIAAADLVTVMENVRHPHREGDPALRGVDY